MKDEKSKKVLRGRKAGILLEDLDAKLDFIVEKVESSEKRLTERIDVFEANVAQQFEDVRLTLRLHGEKLRKHDEDILVLKQSSRH